MGCEDGPPVGSEVGAKVGWDGSDVGEEDGILLGCPVGWLEGCDDG